MTSTPDLDHDTFMSVADLKSYVTQVERAKALKSAEADGGADRAKQELIARMSTPLELTPELMRAFMHRVQAAATAGQTELLLGRFPSDFCRDGGRAINNAEAAWPDTLKGRPRQVYEIWRDQLEPLGYGLKALIVDWPQGMPGDVGLFLTWKK
jgi:hypothetical protein